jgi:hypothetical protein
VRKKLAAILGQEGVAKVARNTDQGSTVQEGYFHVGNGGVSFRVYDAGMGPRLSLSMDSFGTMGSELDFAMSRLSLRQLGTLLLCASEHPGYSGAYSPAKALSVKDFQRGYDYSEFVAALKKLSCEVPAPTDRQREVDLLKEFEEDGKAALDGYSVNSNP